MLIYERISHELREIRLRHCLHANRARYCKNCFNISNKTHQSVSICSATRDFTNLLLLYSQREKGVANLRHALNKLCNKCNAVSAYMIA